MSGELKTGTSVTWGRRTAFISSVIEHTPGHFTSGQALVDYRAIASVQTRTPADDCHNVLVQMRGGHTVAAYFGTDAAARDSFIAKLHECMEAELPAAASKLRSIRKLAMYPTGTWEETVSEIIGVLKA